MDAPKAVACPVCKGWGHEPLPLTSSSVLCHNCGGESIQVQFDDTVLYWDMPDYYDYRGRSQTRIARVMAGLGLGGIVLLFACLFSYLISQTASVL